MTRRRALLAALAAPPLLAAVCAAVFVAWSLPEGLTAPPRVLSLAIEDRHGLPLRTTRAADGSLAQWLPFERIDPQLIQAFVALEDRRFYGHHGVDVRAAARALVQDLRARRVVSGASTITMQLARLLRPGGRGVADKVEQALWALRLEAHLDKPHILEQYLNRVPLGQGAVGVEAGAALYLDASATRLSLGQAALLAGLASAPSADNPFVSAERARSRRATALRRLVALGWAARDAADRAAAEPLLPSARARPFLAPHFTTRLLALAEASGRPLRGVWRTSLDLPLQQEVEAEVRHTVALLGERGVRQAAAVVLDGATGEVLAWVGSPDFWADTSGQVDMVISPRQPGSALKPFLYALAFERGYTASSVLADVARTYATATGPYQPRNYDRRFHGPVRAREALASSFNVPAVELTEALGAPALLRVLHEAGFASLTRGADHYGLGLALGNGDVTLLELANGYRALAAGGLWRPEEYLVPGAPEGARPERAAPGPKEPGLGQAGSAAPDAVPAAGRRVVSAGAAALVLDILSDPAARVPGFGLDTPFEFPFPVAVKTGTSRHFTDNWAIAVTGGFTVAVWAGDFSGRPMRQVSGVTGAGPLLHRIVSLVARRYDPGVLASPAAAGAVRLRVCRLSGLAAGADCPGTDEWFLPGTAPQGECDWHRPGGRVVWPAAYTEWLAQGGAGEAAGTVAWIAEGGTDADPRFRIVSPREGDRYQIPPDVDPRYATIALRAAGAPGETVRWSVDGARVASGRWRLQPGRHVVRASGSSGRSAEVSIEVR